MTSVLAMRAQILQRGCVGSGALLVESWTDAAFGLVIVFVGFCMRSAMRRLGAKATTGARLARSARALNDIADKLSPEMNGATRPIQDAAVIERGPKRLAQALKDLAASDAGTSEIDDRVNALVVLLAEDDADPQPALGLAICASCLGRAEEAYVFAMESLRRGGKHPRAFCIIGLCELENGDRPAAQHHLAAATRLARSRPEFRDELRAAQRLLLILNFGASRRAPKMRKV